MKKKLNIAILTVSDTRNLKTDKSGKLLKDNAELKKMMCDIIPKISTNTNNIKIVRNNFYNFYLYCL